MKKIGIVGCGAIGEGVALFIDKSLKNKVILASLADRSKAKANSLKKKLSPPPRVESGENLVKNVNLVVEAASQSATAEIIEYCLEYKKDAVVLSVGALIKNPGLLRRAADKKINLYIPSGAICGVDGLAALSRANLRKITITTSKPPAGLRGTKYLENMPDVLSGPAKAKIVFSGRVKEAILHFPKNINVAATLLLASQFDKVKVIIKVDPGIKRNIHKITALADEAKIKIEVENRSSKINPKTSALAILSVQYLLEKILSPVKIGS